MTGFFEVISISAPHIYHSALLLSPKTSIVRKLYGPQANPLARVVQGVPTSWEPSIATTSFPRTVRAVAWSLCSRFIAISRGSSDNIAILDAVTLKQIHTTCSVGHKYGPTNLVFSPDGHLLTGHFRDFDWSPNFIASWDLQTGGLISTIDGVISSKESPLMTYSGCGTMIGLLFVKDATITTHNVLSGTHISSHSVKDTVIPETWTHGECLRFATVEFGCITIWEVGFTSGRPPTKVDSLPAPDGFILQGYPAFFPTLSRLAFVSEGRVVVWDAQHRKTLLDSADVTNPRGVSFSPDGRFITCGTLDREFYLWKESPDGYLLHQKFTTGASRTAPIISPDGESIVTLGDLTSPYANFSFAPGDSIARLWRTADSATSLSWASIQSFQDTPEDFILEFSPGEKLVAATRRRGSTITVLDLESGGVRAAIDTGMDICGMRITESAVVAATGGKVVTWDLPAGDRALNVRMGTDDSVRTNMLDGSMSLGTSLPYTSISPDLDHIASKGAFGDLHVYNMHTEKLLTVASSMGYMLGFTPDGHVVWCVVADSRFDRWKITKEGTPDVTELESLGSTEDPPEGCPWRPSHGYQVTGDGRVVSSCKKRLLWLPHHWRSYRSFNQMWRGKFLALLHGELPEVVVLELDL